MKEKIWNKYYFIKKDLTSDPVDVSIFFTQKTKKCVLKKDIKNGTSKSGNNSLIEAVQSLLYIVVKQKIKQLFYLFLIKYNIGTRNGRRLRV